MDSGQWQTIQEMFAASVDLSAEQRRSYLADACADKPEIRAEVESLLGAHYRAGSCFEPVPDQIGPYRLLERIGRGGMGSVYRAERSDGQFQQQVAVKLWSVAASATLYRRFLDERQILANLSHANIAGLLDGGVTPLGLSYIVMEYVDGVPIDQYCHGRPLAERLQLFREICAAVHYAHQHLVVHRDLKPANILVTAEGVPKLLDFGIAKVLSPAKPTEGATVQPAMTPEYASPEQFRGGRISTMSDVYSLGLLLCELLTGRRPYDLTGKTFEEAIRIVCEQPPGKLRTESADLDAIIAKAMRLEPGERYSSADTLSADIGRYQSKRPVEARRGAAWYVFTTFLARNKVPVATACAVVCLLAVAVAVTVRENRISARRFNDVRQLANVVLFQIHDAVAALPGSTPVRKLIVANALEYLDKLSRDAADPKLQLELAEGYSRLGDVQGFQSQANLGDPNGAVASYRKARLHFNEALRAHPADSRAISGMAQTYRRLGTVLAFLRQGGEARQMAAQAVTLMESLAQREPTERNRQSLAAAYSSMADVSDGNLEYRSKALSIFEELLVAHPQDRSRQRDVALVHKYIAGAQLVNRSSEGTEQHLHRAEELDAARAAAAPDDREAQLDLSFDYSQNGTYYLNREKLPAALENYQKTLEIRLRLARSDPADARLQDRVVYAYSQIGKVWMKMENPREALRSFEDGLRTSQALQARDPNHPQFRSNLATSQSGVGDAESALGNTRQACAAWRGALSVYGQMERDGQLRSSERPAMEELQQRVGKCAPEK